MNTRLTSMRGISLLEGLIAVVVLAIGVLALFRFQTAALQSGVDAKMRTEALMIAETRVGQLRDYATRRLQFEELEPGEEFYDLLQAEASRLDELDSNPNVSGSRATYLDTRFGTDREVRTTVSGDSDPPTVAAVTVTVAWRGVGAGDDDVADSETSVSRCVGDLDLTGTGIKCVSTGALISLKDPLASLILARTADTGGGGFVRPPSGDAEYGRGEKNTEWKTYSKPGDVNYDSSKPESIVGDRGDGTVLVMNAVNSYQLIDTATNEILIKSGNRLVFVSGTVYVAPSMTISRDWIKVGAPDVSVCRTATDADDPDAPAVFSTGEREFVRYQVTKANGDLVYDALPYTCYVGLGWYGSIGPQAYDPDDRDLKDLFDPALQAFKKDKDLVCVGEDGVPDSGLSNSRHPQMSYIRSYRGYTQLTANGGPVRDAEGNLLFTSAGMTVERAGEDFGWYFHDFLLYNDKAKTTCNDELLAGENATQPGKVTFTIAGGCAQGNPNCPDGGNPGKFYCLTESCPSPLPAGTGEAVATRAITINAGFSTEGGTAVAGGTITVSDGTTCTSDDQGVATCVVYAAATSGWSGSITAKAPAGYALKGTAQRTKTLAANESAWSEDFWLEAVTAGTPRKISGLVTLNGAAYSGVSSDKGGSCRVPMAGSQAIGGDLTTSVVNDTAKTITISNVSTNLTDVRVDIAQNLKTGKNKCPNN